MTGVGDDNIKGILREISGIPNCPKYNTDILENMNVEELLVIPMAEEDDEARSDIKELCTTKSVRRKWTKRK